jgi:oligopeptide/dipeptide ABC transporter ATP-binding protein
MYAGQVVEHASVDDFFAAPRHPYSRGLLDSMPQSVVKGERLRLIAGTVPLPSRFPSGCRFAPRCPHVIEECTTAPPELEVLADGRAVRCIRHADVASEAVR